MLFAQISDLHVTARGIPCGGRISTNECLARAVAHLNALEPAPDFVVVTGDLVDTGQPEEYVALAELMAPLRMPCYVIPGNHDDRASLRSLFGEGGYLPQSGDFLHYTLESYPVRFIALDTVVAGEPYGGLDAPRLGWVAKRLAEAPDRPTIVLMHHPPVVTGIHHMDEMRCLNEAPFGYLVESYACVERILCGHVHRPITVRWSETVVTVGPSTAHHVALDLGGSKPPGWTLEPPAVALHLWRPGVGLISHLSYIGDFPGGEFAG